MLMVVIKRLHKMVTQGHDIAPVISTVTRRQDSNRSRRHSRCRFHTADQRVPMITSRAMDVQRRSVSVNSPPPPGGELLAWSLSRYLPTAVDQEHSNTPHQRGEGIISWNGAYPTLTCLARLIYYGMVHL